MIKNRREFIKWSGMLAGGLALQGMQSCSKKGVQPFKQYGICENTCTGCGDCLDVCQDNAILLPEKSFFKIEGESCVVCGECVPVCEYEAIQVTLRKYHLDSESCVGCGKCLDVCDLEGKAISWERDYYKIRGKCKTSQCQTECMTACEDDAITIADGKAVIDLEKCTRCGKCVPVCPKGAVNPAHVLMDETLCTQCGKCVPVCEFENVIHIEEPEGYAAPHIDADLCQFCGECKDACEEFEAIGWAMHTASIDDASCIGCGECNDVCSFDAVRSG